MTSFGPNSKLNSSHLVNGLTAVLIAEVVYVLGTISLKVTLGLLFLRIFIVKWQRWFIYVVMAVNVVYGIFFFFYVLFQCGTDLGDFFQKTEMQECANEDSVAATLYIHSAISVIR